MIQLVIVKSMCNERLCDKYHNLIFVLVNCFGLINKQSVPMNGLCVS